MSKEPEAFRTISEVAEDLDIPQHVLRFWETRFSQIKPMKRGGGRRYYRPADVELLRGIKHLLYGEGYTIKGVQKILRDSGAKHVQMLAEGDDEVEAAPVVASEAPSSPETPPSPDPGLVSAPPEPTEADPKPEPEPRRRLVVAPLMSDEPEPLIEPEDERPGASPISTTPDTADLIAGLTDDDRKTLKNVLFELGECKRILDGARDTS